MKTFTILVLAAVLLAIVIAVVLTRSSSPAPVPARSSRVRPVLLRHPVNALLPVGIRAIIQDGLLEAAFQNAMVPDFLFPSAADADPVSGNIGQKITRTRTGLLAPADTALTGDAGASTYAIEQFSGTLDQYGNSIDTNMLGSAVSQASTFVRNVQTLGTNAGQSINRVARNRLYASYGGGRTWTRTTDGASNTTIDVQSVDGFEFVLVNGVPTAVSPTNPLSITINGVANTVTGVDRANRRLTLGTGVTDTLGQPIVAANAPTTLRPNARASAFNLLAGDVLTVGLVFDAVARLRQQNVPPAADGTYQCHLDATSQRQLLADAEFRQAFQSQGAGDVYQQGRITVFGGATFIINNEVPTVSGDGMGISLARRPIVLGGGSLISMPLEGQGQLLTGTGVEDVPGISLIEAAPGVEVALIVRPPQDRLQQVVAASWAWTGDYAVPSDSTTGDAAMFKRAVVIEHA